MSGHISDNLLADYAGDVLKSRKFAKVSSHLAGCTMCTGRLDNLHSMPSLLASVSYPPIPQNLTTRIDSAIATESAARVAAEPATEADRRDLPQRAEPPRPGWRPPRLTSPVALRTLAAVGAAVVVAGGGYEIAAHSGGSATTNGPSSAAALPASLAPLTTGPPVSYQQDGHAHSINTVESNANFQASTLRRQTQATLAEMGLGIVNGTPKVAGTSGHAPNSFNTAAAPQPKAFTRTGMHQLAGCVTRISAGGTVVMVELANYQGTRATIIVVQPKGPVPAQVFAVGTACSATNSDILAQQQLQLPNL